MTTPSPNNAFGTFLLPNVGPPIYFDCVLTEQVTRDAEITEFPVETGANISDHYRVKLTQVKLDVFVSQEPINPLIHASGNGFWGAQTLVTPPYPAAGLGSTIAKAVLNPVGSVTSLVGQALDSTERPVVASPVLQWGTPFDSLQELLTALDTIRSTAGLLDIYTRSAVYQSFVLGQIVTNRDKETGSGAKVTIEFHKIVTVSTLQVAAPKPVKPKDTPPVSKGAQQPQQVPAEKQSFASAVVGLFKGN
jgi:hypothetical protein